jgi:site-specific DNA-cytosine methylase
MFVPATYDMKQHHNPQTSSTVQLTTKNCSFVRGDTPLVQPIPLPAVAQPIASIDASGSNPAMHQGGAAIVSPTLTASNDPSRSPQSTEVTNQVAAIHAVSMAVRRLTPTECERLQGFPDGYTNIPWRKKPESPDGPRYKALGNSWAVPVVAWIGRRIEGHLS